MPCYKSKFKKKNDAYSFKKTLDKYEISLSKWELSSKPKKKKKR